MNLLSTRSENDLEAAGDISKTQQNKLGEKTSSAGNRKCLCLCGGAELSLSHCSQLCPPHSVLYCSQQTPTGLCALVWRLLFRTLKSPAYVYLVLQFSEEKSSSSSESVTLKRERKGHKCQSCTVYIEWCIISRVLGHLYYWLLIDASRIIADRGGKSSDTTNSIIKERYYITLLATSESFLTVWCE